MTISIAGLVTKLRNRRLKNRGLFPAEGREISLFREGLKLALVNTQASY